MKTKTQIEEELALLEEKIIQAKLTGKGYNSFSNLRRDETKITTLKWVLE
jgi:hypothetical protein